MTSPHISYRDGQNKRVEVKLLLHASFSPDLVPSDYFLYQYLKKWVCGKIFANNEEIELTINGYFEEFGGSYYKQGIKAIEHRWEKFI